MEKPVHSIRGKFIAAICGLLVAFSGLILITSARSAQDVVFTEKRNSLSASAGTISTSLGNLSAISNRGISEVLNILGVEGLSRIIITDATGKVIYDDHGSVGVDAKIKDIYTALEGKSVFRSVFSSGSFISTVSMPIASGGKISGILYIEEIDSERAQLLTGMTRQTMTFSALFLVVAVLIIVVLVSVMTRRIRLLSGAIRIVAGGDYNTRTEISGQDEISELSREFNELTQRLQETEFQRRRFVSDASHELKTPLASIRLLSDSVVQNPGTDRETMYEFFQDIEKEAERLQRTTEDLLRLSRLDDGVEVKRTPVDIDFVAMDTIKKLMPLAKQRSVSLIPKLCGEAVIQASEDDMFHIIYNLVENAIKYNTAGGKVNIITEKSGNRVTLTIADTGIGIPAEDAENIFRRFYRVDKARSREDGGSGLGLSIVRDAAKNNGGRVRYEPNEPNGSRFVVEFESN